MSTSDNVLPFPRLTRTTWSLWHGKMTAHLMRKGYQHLVAGTDTRASYKEAEDQRKWDERSEKAAGEIYLAVNEDLQAKLDGLLATPWTMWTTLESECISKRPGARFNTYDDLMQIRKKEKESLTDLVNRVDVSAILQ